MIWLCRECGDEVTGDDPLDAAWNGWNALDGDTGVCPACAGLFAKRTPALRIADTGARVARTRRSLVTTRALIERSSGRPRWDEALIEAAADRLGFSPEVCASCAPNATVRCEVCEGMTLVWHRAGKTVSGRTVLRMAMWPRGT
jgi:hypothetical protein